MISKNCLTTFNVEIQKLSAEVLYEKRYSWEFCKIHRKISGVCQGLFFNKVTGLRPATLLKKNSGTGVFLWSLQNFWEHPFYRTPLMTASQNKSFFSEKQMGIQFKRISHQITKFVEFFVQKDYHTYYNSIVTENI